VTALLPRSAVLVLLAGLPVPVVAQSTGAAGADEPAALAKKLANPVASLISVPFQFN
jgi:hypothetical protein